MSATKRRLAAAAAAVGLLVLAAAFLLRFSYSTSFKWPEYCGYDSAIFQTIGKYWAQGSVPYRDLFDHKGPLIFFIDMIGYLIWGRAGILVPQTISLAVTLFFFWKLGRVYLPPLGAAAAAGVALVYLARTFDEGNMTEEYALPFIAASLWLAVRWCESLRETPDAPHPWRSAAVYGLSFGAILMLRLRAGHHPVHHRQTPVACAGAERRRFSGRIRRHHRAVFCLFCILRGAGPAVLRHDRL